MGEGNLHKFLKNVGIAFLHNQKCFMVATEVGVLRDHGLEKHELDNHFIMDVVGIGVKYIPMVQRLVQKDELTWVYKSDKYYNYILRGIEVKTSRSDLKNGFCCTGCNYHYLLTPMRLVNSAEIPKWVGLIEYNKHKFNIFLGSDRRFWIEGLRVVKNPQHRETNEVQIQKAITDIGKRLHWTLISTLKEQLQKPLLKEVGDG